MNPVSPMQGPGVLPPDVAPNFDPADAPSDDRQRRLLASVPLYRKIRKVAKSHYVPNCDRNDIAQETIVEALRARLPAEDDEASRYVHRIAANVSSDHMRGATAVEIEPYIEDPDEQKGEAATPVSAKPADFEVRDLLVRIYARGCEQFPRWFPLFVEARLNGETSTELAERTGLSPSFLRAQCSSIERFVRDYGRTLGFGFAVLLAIALGLTSRRVNEERPAEGRDIATVEPRRVTPPPSAGELRERAAAACDAGAWQACLDDLDAADVIDPAGETPSLQGLRDRARSHVIRVDIPVEPRMTDDKPPAVH